MYADYMPADAQLLREVLSLTGKQLVCECDDKATCHVQVLRSVWLLKYGDGDERLAPSVQWMRSSTIRALDWRALVQPASFLEFTQWSLVSLLDRIMESPTGVVQWPPLDDLVNFWPFMSFRDWL